MPPDECCQLFFRLPREQIAYVRFIVESYEGLAQVTSLPGRGEMEWLIPRPLVKFWIYRTAWNRSYSRP